MYVFHPALRLMRSLLRTDDGPESSVTHEGRAYKSRQRPKKDASFIIQEVSGDAQDKEGEPNRDIPIPLVHSPISHAVTRTWRYIQIGKAMGVQDE